jgi:F-type H+-transporting ATPase subunit delta
VRQSIRGYTDAIIEQAGAEGELGQVASELAGIADLLNGSEDLRRVLDDPDVPVPARRGVVTDLLQSRVSDTTMRLVTFALQADRATEFQKNVGWLASRIDASARHLAPVGDVVLGRRAAIERVDGYATALLQDIEDRGALGDVEDELFRFMRVVDGSDDLLAALSNRDLDAAARRSIVVDLLQGRATSTTTRLATYATQVGRPRDYANLLGHLVDRVAAESNRRLATVRSAVDLDDARRNQLAGVLTRIAGHNVDVRVTVDPTVLGGFVATIGDTVVDGSTRHRLDLLKTRLDTPEADITLGERS